MLGLNQILAQFSAFSGVKNWAFGDQPGQEKVTLTLNNHDEIHYN